MAVAGPAAGRPVKDWAGLVMDGSGLSWHAHKPSACSDYSTETVFAKGDFGRNPMVNRVKKRLKDA